MAVGAGFAGFTCYDLNIRPGLSLMTEIIIGLAYYAEVPVLIWMFNEWGPAQDCQPEPPKRILAL